MGASKRARNSKIYGVVVSSDLIKSLSSKSNILPMALNETVLLKMLVQECVNSYGYKLQVVQF